MENSAVVKFEIAISLHAIKNKTKNEYTNRAQA